MQAVVTLPNPHPGQYDVLASPARYRVLMCGRRWGKSLISQNLAAEGGLNRQEVAYITPTYQLAEYFFEELVKLLPAAVVNTNKAKLLITFVTGGYIQFFTGERLDNLRGRRFHLVIVDEASYISDLEHGWMNSIRPTLTDYRGRAIFLSTPKGKNYFYSLYTKGGEADWDVFKFPTATNPYIHPQEIEDARRMLPDAVFRQEYEADPAENADNPFGLAHIQQCTFQLSTKPAAFFGIDLAKSSDWTVIIGFDQHGQTCHFERFQHVPWDEVKRRIEALPRVPTLIDSTGVGDPIVESLQKGRAHIEGFKFTSTSKQQLIEGLASAIHQRKITFPEGHITQELGIFEYTYTARGVVYSAPTGFHDDCVCALALANRAYETKAVTGRYSYSYA